MKFTLELLRKKKLLFGGFLLLALVILPVTLFFFQQNQITSSRAEKTVDLSFEPGFSQTDNALHIPAGSTFTLDVYLDPGANAVSFVKLEMLYDSTKFEPAGGFIPDQNVFTQIVEGPVDQPGKVTATLSIGSDLSKALKVRTKIGTLALKARDNATNADSVISFGSGTQALSISNNSSYSENVIANTTPVTININKSQLTCGQTPSDVMLTMDTSDSMKESAGSTSKLSAAKSAAKNFIDLIAAESGVRIGLVTFDIGSVLRSGLTTNYASVKSTIDEDTHTGNQTCMQCGILTTNQEISAHKRSGVKNVVILITDGDALNYIGQKSGTYNKTLGEKYALQAAKDGHKANGTIFYTIGLGNGSNFDPAFLKTLASATGGQYYYSPDVSQLNGIYSQISKTLLGGSVTGTVFNDANGNGVYEPPEPGMSGVLLWLYPLNSTKPQALISTSSDGRYNLQHLCDGTYTIKQDVPTTWKQTLPSDIRGYTFNMINGKAVTDENFGDKKLPRCSDNLDNDGNGAADRADSTCHTDGNPNNPGSYDPNKDGEHGNSTCSDSKDNNGNGLVDGEDPVCHVDGNANNPSSYDETRDEGALPTVTPVPTETPVPAATSTPAPSATPTQTPNESPTPQPNGKPLSLDILLHGIGNSGDNANPTESSLSNKTPVHPSRNAHAEIFDINNNLVGTASGTIKYSSSSGSFTGNVYLDHQITAGNYSVYVASDFHLVRRIPNILNLTPNQANQVPQAALVAGDVNNDNQLNILDYNLILDCYSDLSPAANCDDTKKVMTDLNDDGNVNQFDYNLFLREISTQPGD
ncbi:MAG TPA: VWA domain-containing protein [Candidatus Acidoferrales bacterium]|nr:VWA domain-containing protein [Candidatus Acidoferrales bacterium]